MPSRAALGIDLGTSSVKTVVTDPASGAVLAQASVAYPVRSPQPGQAETDPADWWDAVGRCVREAVAASGAQPDAIGLSGQMHGLVLCDARAVPVRPAMLWADMRAVAEIGRFHELSREHRARLANPLTPGMPGPMLVWVAAHQPEVYARARWALQPKDWLRARLTGGIMAEPSDASATLLYDLPADDWDRELIETLGLRADLLAPLLPSSAALAGALSDTAASHLGVPAGTPVAAGAGDAAAAALGSGLADPSQVQLTVGTGAQVVRPQPSPLDLSAAGVHLYRSAYGAPATAGSATPAGVGAAAGWYHMGACTNAGIALTWVREILGMSWSQLYASLDEPVRPDDPMFIPHLTGERTPYVEPGLRGSWTALALGHDRTALARSALVGVAFAITDTYRALIDAGAGDSAPKSAGPSGANRDPADATLRVAGGGTMSPAWRQLLADITGCALYALDCPDASGRGAALLGAQAAGSVTTEEIIGRLAPQVSLVAEPADGSARSLLADRYQQFRERIQLLGGAQP
ncbi:MAG: FGGY family carbohydrate kinase [Actinomycetia bacterium]|nr:FGGY family carbohydrate kinase [Actinomycetes bacterium]